MEARIVDLPNQCRQAWKRAMSVKLPVSYRRAESVVIAGMGGSAIGSDLVSDLASLEKAPPIVSCRDYSIPRWVDEQTLVVVSSHSGNTEEALSSFWGARRSGACVIAMTAGGRLKEIAQGADVPALQMISSGEPRAAIGYSFVGLMGLLCSLGMLTDKARDVEEATRTMEKQIDVWRSSTPTEVNEAKKLANDLWGQMVVVYGAGILAGVARRWKTQLNENAKTWAFFDVLPEASHNSIEGYSFPADTKDKVFLVFLRSSYVHPRTLARYELIGEILADAGIRHREIEAVGDVPMSHILSSVLFSDYVSYYLGLLNGVDPSSTDTLNSIKATLANLPNSDELPQLRPKV